MERERREERGERERRVSLFFREKQRRQKCMLHVQCPGQHVLTISGGRVPNPAVPQPLPPSPFIHDTVSSLIVFQETMILPPFNLFFFFFVEIKSDRGTLGYRNNNCF